MSDVAIIGAGLAGSACAYVCQQYGLTPVVYDQAKTPASAASGNALGLYNPRLTADRGPESIYYESAFFKAFDTFKNFENIDFNPCGALHLMNTETKKKRFPKTLKSWGWGEEHMRIVSPEEGCTILGLSIRNDALYISKSGYLSPKKLCAAYLNGIESSYQTEIQNVDEVTQKYIIIAAGAASEKLLNMSLSLRSVRGQVTHIQPNDFTSDMNCALCYGGYILPPHDGKQIIGATFQRWLDHSDIIPEDDEDNIRKLKEAVPDLGSQDFNIIGHRASVRTTSPDHFPLVGPVPGRKNTYISTAHGSHGILSSLMAAHLIAQMITDAPKSLPISTIKKLDPMRFVTGS